MCRWYIEKTTGYIVCGIVIHARSYLIKYTDLYIACPLKRSKVRTCTHLLVENASFLRPTSPSVPIDPRTYIKFQHLGFNSSLVHLPSDWLRCQPKLDRQFSFIEIS